MRYVALLRGINVSGQKMIKMDALKLHFDMPGISNVVTYIQSGNVLFDTKETDNNKLRNKIEKQLTLKLGYDVPTIVRSLEEIKEAVDNCPFTEELPERRVYIIFLSAAPPAALHTALDTYKNDAEEIKVIGQDLYIVSGGIGKSKLTLALIEKKLGVTATMRNLTTSKKLLEL